MGGSTVVAGVSAAWVGLVAGVSAAWVGLVAGVSAAWVGLVAGVSAAWVGLSLQYAQSEEGKCRAWIRLAVNECSLESYIGVLCSDASLLG